MAATREEMIMELEYDIVMRSRRMQQHEMDNTQLRENIISLEKSILEMQGILGEYYSSLPAAKKDENSDFDKQSEEETIKKIVSFKNSAAAIFYTWKRARPVGMPLILNDVVGIVATLGKVHDHNLSRLLSEFLGHEKMMAIVVRTYKHGVKALEGYNTDGSVCLDRGLHALGSYIGTPIDGRFDVIYLEKLRPYAGEFVCVDGMDPQRRLNLYKPRLPNGEVPPGFLGFAVNMIHIDDDSSELSLRETLFYHLFSHLQVYATREEMYNALPLISHGAISMDGGIIKTNGLILLGTRQDVDVVFPVTSKVPPFLPEKCIEVAETIKVKQVEKQKLLENLERQESMLNYVKSNLEVKKMELKRLKG